MTQTLTLLAEDVSREMRETIQEAPNKVFFPNFGSGESIFQKGIPVSRVFLTIPGTNFNIYWYGFLIAVGILLAMLYGFKKMKPVGIDPDRATDAVISGFIGALLGARAYYIAFNANASWSDFFNYRDGGLAIYGGIIGAILVGGIVTVMRGLKLAAMVDVAAPCFFIGQAIGRWGNFFNQECFGENTDLPWGMMSSETIRYISEHYDDLGGKVSSYAPVHPCFLYESLWCAAGFLFLHLYFNHKKFDGEIFLMYAGLYGLGRFFIEGTRTDSLYIANIKVSQLVAGTCFLASFVLIIIFRSSAKRGGYTFFSQTELSKRQMAALAKYEKDEKERLDIKKRIASAKKAGESFIELEKEYDAKFGKGAKEEAKKKAAELAEKKKELKEKLKAAKQSGRTDEYKALKYEYALNFGGYASEPPKAAGKSDDGYKSILADDDGSDNAVDNAEDNKENDSNNTEN